MPGTMSGTRDPGKKNMSVDMTCEKEEGQAFRVGDDDRPSLPVHLTCVCVSVFFFLSRSLFFMMIMK